MQLTDLNPADYGILGVVIVGAGTGMWYWLKVYQQRLIKIQDERSAEHKEVMEWMREEVKESRAQVEEARVKAQEDRNKMMQQMERTREDIPRVVTEAVEAALEAKPKRKNR